MNNLTNPLATAEQLHRRNTFSSLPTDLQDAVFYAVQCLTQAAGVLLELPQSTTAQANVLLARYWLVDPMMQHEFADVSAACLYVVAKCGADPRTPREVANVYAYLLSPVSPFVRDPSVPEPVEPPSDPSEYVQSEPEYIQRRARILKLEARVLLALSFDTHVALPHPVALTYLQALDFLGQEREDIGRRVVAYLNAALLSPQMLYLTHQPNALAVAAIYNAARDMGASMPECEWWEVFDVEREELGFLVVGMRSLEGWVRQQREAPAGGAVLPAVLGGSGGMFSRKFVEKEMERRGFYAGKNGSAADQSVVDDETEMMRRMDERMAEMDKN